MRGFVWSLRPERVTRHKTSTGVNQRQLASHPRGFDPLIAGIRCDSRGFAGSAVDASLETSAQPSLESTVRWDASPASSDPSQLHRLVEKFFSNRTFSDMRARPHLNFQKSVIAIDD